ANSSGQITYSADVALTSLTAFGLPFQPTLLTRRVELRGAQSIQGTMKRWSDLWIRVYNTINLTVNNQIVPFNDLTGVMQLPSVPADSYEPGQVYVPGTNDTMSDEQPPLSADLRIFNFGYDRFGRVN